MASIKDKGIGWAVCTPTRLTLDGSYPPAGIAGLTRSFEGKLVFTIAAESLPAVGAGDWHITLVTPSVATITASGKHFRIKVIFWIAPVFRVLKRQKHNRVLRQENCDCFNKVATRTPQTKPLNFTLKYVIVKVLA
jgi:hypothetical protein